MADLGGIQLIPGTKKRLGLKERGENLFLYMGSAILGAVLVLSFAVVRYEGDLGNKIDFLNGQISALEEQRDKAAEENLLVVKEQLELTSGLLKSHLRWPKALAVLESLLQDQVRFESMSAKIQDGAIDISGFASSYNVIAKQIASFLSGKGISDVMIGKTSSSPSGQIQFDMRVKFKQSELLQ